MKRILPLLCAMLLVAPLMGQERGTTNGSGGNNLLDELWNMQDANPIDAGQWDLRFTFGWVTESAPANLGESGDDFYLQPSWVWGVSEDMQLTFSVPVWIGNGGDVGAIEDGNGDLYVNLLWKFAEQADDWPAMAVSVSARFPTGEDSDGIDGGLRFILTNDYSSGMRSHVNIFALSSNTANDEGLRDLQYGLVVGMDGPLCADVRWVADYMHRSSEHDGLGNMNLVELGWEWAMADATKLGMSLQVGVDHTSDTPNFGAKLTYSHALTY